MTQPVVSTTPRPSGDREPARAALYSGSVFRWCCAVAIVGTGVALAAVRAGAESPSGASVEFFEKRVRPVLVEKCQRCHGRESPKGGLSLVSREGLLKGGESGPVVNPGHPEKSELVRAINYEADGFQMPPTGKLDTDSIGALTEWIRAGAPWPDHSTADGPTKAVAGMDFAQRARHWAFQPLRLSTPPTVAESSWSRNPVDAFLASRHQAVGCTHAAEADRRTLLRRLTFDLTGLPPTPTEIDNFLANDSPRAYEDVVTRLLASPRYGVRWARHWLDLVRFAETAGHEFDYPIAEAWRYRDYVVRALNDDLPYNQFVTEQIAGDLLPKPRRNPLDRTNESILGTAFWWFGQAKHSPVDLRAEECDRLDNQIDVMGKAFLGLSIACARCHDHKFDAIRAQDYYALTGFLRSSRQQLAFLADPRPADDFANWRRACQPRCVELIGAELMGRSLDPHSWSTVSNDDEIIRPWQELKTVPVGRFVVERKKQAEKLQHRADLASRHESRSTPFEPFDTPSFGGWRSSGTAFGNRPSRAGDFVLGTTAGQPVLEFAEPGAAHSGLISRRLRGALRSKTFTITQPFIHYRAARRQSDGGTPRPFKSGQLNLVVDGFQIIRDPLYGPLTLSVENDAPASWYSQNVAKLIGNRAYIEIVDEDDGWISVDAIRFSDGPSPPLDRPNELIAALLNDPAIDNAAKLTKVYAKLFEETVSLWTSGRLTADPSARARVAILNSLVSHPGRAPGLRDSKEVALLLDEKRRRESELVPSPRALALADGSGENDHILVRGNPRKPGEEVARRFLEVFRGTSVSDAEPGSGRLALAQSLTRSASALVARVMVNRLWHHHFGRGLVASTDDFGKMGEPPSHPELLDYLAGELIRSGWSIKHVQRLLVTSAAYRMSSREPDERSKAVDPENRLVHRATVKRLEAEAIRDSILAVSGHLNERLDGPSIPVHLDDFMTGRGRPSVSGPLDGRGRRSLYLEVRRNFLTPLFLAFDFPIPSTAAGRRSQSNVPAQALSLLNDPFVSQQAHAWAKRTLAPCVPQTTQSCKKDAQQSDSQIDALIDRLYETAFARVPTDEERALGKEFLRQATSKGPTADEETLAGLCHVLFNVKEFLYVN
ncbi:MAG TPA: PSD1 and planctomycete cytochrome C domain-containing protein [Planctomycetaceae bacterium]|nr:PSD1 and planctomycete cytochrome C domain-containing protein [Planctomycetaceae bacterium]